MEDAPEEAVKNNVFGTLNVARMADACGAERFVAHLDRQGGEPDLGDGGDEARRGARRARPRAPLARRG